MVSFLCMLESENSVSYSAIIRYKVRNFGQFGDKALFINKSFAQKEHFLTIFLAEFSRKGL